MKARDVKVTCKGCGEVIVCPVNVGSGKTSRNGVAVLDCRIDFAPLRAHHRVTGHKVDGTPFPTPQNVPA